MSDKNNMPIGMEGIDFGKLVSEAMGETEVTKTDFIIIGIRRVINEFIHVYMKLLIGIMAMIMTAMFYPKFIYLNAIMLILWIGRPVINKLFDILMKALKKKKRKKINER